MTEQTFIRPAGKFGLRESHEPTLMLSNFHTPAPAPASWDGTHGITNWGMDGNDQWGDCGAAATDHYNMAKTGDPTLLNKLGNPKFNGTLATYWAYGLSQGEVGQPPNPPNEPDQGVDNASWLGFLYQQGIIDGYAEVSLDQLHAAAFQFNGALLGVQLSDNAQQEFSTVPPTPWGSNPDVPDPTEGHDILFVAYDEQGNGTVVTWGALQPCLANFFSDNVTDAWVILDEEDAKRMGVDWNALQSALQALHGTVRPVPAPTPAPPAPIPNPEPVPTPPIITPAERIENFAAEAIANITNLVKEAIADL